MRRLHRISPFCTMAAPLSYLLVSGNRTERVPLLPFYATEFAQAFAPSDPTRPDPTRPEATGTETRWSCRRPCSPPSRSSTAPGPSLLPSTLPSARTSLPWWNRNRLSLYPWRRIPFLPTVRGASASLRALRPAMASLSHLRRSLLWDSFSCIKKPFFFLGSGVLFRSSCILLITEFFSPKKSDPNLSLFLCSFWITDSSDCLCEIDFEVNFLLIFEAGRLMRAVHFCLQGAESFLRSVLESMEIVYLNRNPTARAVLELVPSAGEDQICYDHFAFRTFGVLTLFVNLARVPSTTKVS